MRTVITALFVSTALAWVVAPAYSQQDHGSHHASTGVSATDMTTGEVRKIDKVANKITLRHDEIKNLDMPPMTMVFQVKDPAMLEKVQAGDKVRFKAEKVSGAYTVTALEAAK